MGWFNSSNDTVRMMKQKKIISEETFWNIDLIWFNWVFSSFLYFPKKLFSLKVNCGTCVFIHEDKHDFNNWVIRWAHSKTSCFFSKTREYNFPQFFGFSSKMRNEFFFCCFTIFFQSLEKLIRLTTNQPTSKSTYPYSDSMACLKKFWYKLYFKLHLSKPKKFKG